MPPKAQANTPRGRGRPKKDTAPEPTPVAETRKRGRAAKESTDVIVESPKKRGRPARVQVDEPAVFADPPRRGRRAPIVPEPVTAAESPPPQKPASRPRKEQIDVQAEPTPKKRGRPSKNDATATDTDTPKTLEALTTPKRRGRPVSNAPAVNLNRVADVGSSRIAKRISPRSKRTTRKVAVPAPAPRMNPRMRSKLRTRLAPQPKVAKAAPISQPTKRRGRPAKAAVAAAPAAKKARIPTASQPVVTQAKVPRKKRGYTSIEIPDRFITQVEQLLQDLQDAENINTPMVSDDEVEAEGQDDLEDIPAEEDQADVEVQIEDDIVTSAIVAANGLGDAAVIVDGEAVGEQMESNGENLEDDTQPDATHDETLESILDEEPAGVATEIDVNVNIHEEAQLDETTGNVESIVQQVEEIIEFPEADPESLLDAADDDTDAYIRDLEPQPSAGLIFG